MFKFMKFYENVDMSRLRGICHRGGIERGATAMNLKMMSRLHIGSDSSWRYRCKRKNDGSVLSKMVGCSRLPGVPHDGGKETRNVQGSNRAWCKHGVHLIHHTTYVHGSRLGLYLQSVQTGRFEFVEGSSRSAMVEEVVVQLVLAGSGTRSF